MNQNYPQVPGYKADGPSAIAAAKEESRSATLREKILDKFKQHPHGYQGGWTTDEMAQYLGESVLAVRPRFTELKVIGKIKDGLVRRKNSSGHTATVWVLVRQQVQQEMFA